MANNNKNILECFPFKVFRPYQKEVIQKIDAAFNSGKRFAILDVQTGGGKSAIGITHARYRGPCYILTPQKLLQDQYMRDFGNEIIDLKGRNAYECILANGMLTGEKVYCHKGLCKQQGKSKLPECVDKAKKDRFCPYFKRLAEAKESPITLFNFKSFLFQANYARQFTGRKLLIIDEAHNIESQLMDFVVINLADKDFADDGVVFPEMDSPREYLVYFQRIELLRLIEGKLAQARRYRDIDAQEKWEELAKRFEGFVKSVEQHEFISEYKLCHKFKGGEPYRMVTLKPLFIKQYASEMLFNFGDKVILMSATILDHRVFCESLGIPLAEVEYISAPSTFPVENRLIRLRCAGSMNYQEKQATLPKLVQKIEGGLDVHKDDRGIIHTHSFEITNYIKKNISRKYLSRLLFQEDFPDKDALLKRHTEISNAVIVAPAMHEGLDLKDDLSRFQMICKVPYPDGKNDKQLRKSNWQP